MAHVEVIGVYPVEAPEPVHLVEIRVTGADTAFAVAQFTQETPGQPQLNWQVPYMEQILSADGTEVVADDSQAGRRPELFRGDVRSVFFFHYLDLDRPLRTPFGEITVPGESALPERLSMIEYAQP